MKVLVVLNSKARDGGRGRIKQQIERTFFRHDVRVETPATVEEAQRLFRAAAADLVVIAGGDGTVNAALHALPGTIPLGIIPSGTANDFAEELGLPTDVEHACEIVKLKRTRDVDLLDVNGRVFITSGGTGLAADVAVDTNRFKTLVAQVPGVRDVVKSMGKELYSVFLLKEFAFPAEHVRRLALAWDAGDLKVETALVMINNQPIVGGSFKIAPGTKNDDGTFCVSVFLDQDAAGLARATAQVRSGRLPAKESLLQFETKTLRIEALDGHPARFFGDGELLADTSAPIIVTTLPGARRVVVP